MLDIIYRLPKQLYLMICLIAEIKSHISLIVFQNSNKNNLFQKVMLKIL